MSAPQTPRERYLAHRYWNLCELRLIRAKLRVGNTTAANATKDRHAIQRDRSSSTQTREIMSYASYTTGS
jgi:hypothetical protein